MKGELIKSEIYFLLVETRQGKRTYLVIFNIDGG
jgi:hypothetical protein